MTEREAIALTIYGEARGETTDGRIAVACTIQNRVRDGRWGSTFESVCLKPYQFSCWNVSDPNSDILRSLIGRNPDGNPVLKECYWIADGILAGAIRPRVGQSTHYYASSMTTPPNWALGHKVYAKVGHHTFYENIA